MELKPLVEDATIHDRMERQAPDASDQYVLCREEFYTVPYRELRRLTRITEAPWRERRSLLVPGGKCSGLPPYRLRTGQGAGVERAGGPPSAAP
ncbi:MAG TPA: hypothetical protein VKB88_03570 [Bryobacteraceae bacterium]|nr:hypothetical protein [Bryobacteraceae bacterium]